MTPPKTKTVTIKPLVTFWQAPNTSGDYKNIATINDVSKYSKIVVKAQVINTNDYIQASINNSTYGAFSLSNIAPPCNSWQNVSFTCTIDSGYSGTANISLQRVDGVNIWAFKIISITATLR